MQESIDSLTEAMAHLRAKSAGGPSGQLFPHLVCVCRQSAEYFSVFEPKWPLRDSICLSRVLAYSSLLHDFGKIHRDFQLMVYGTGTRFANRHEILSLAFLNWLEGPEDELCWIAAAIATHHREWSFLKERYTSTNNAPVTGSYAEKLINGVNDTDAELLHRVLSAAREIFDKTGWNKFEAYTTKTYESNYWPNMRIALNSIGRLAESFDPPTQFRPGPKAEPDWRRIQAAIHARGWLINADHLASFQNQEIERALTSVDNTSRLLRDAIRKRRANFSDRWPSHQENACVAKGSSLLEAPTGSGKTEASLLWAARQAEDGLGGRTYLVLPYQASMNAMQDRLIRDLFPSSYGSADKWTKHIALVHGRSVRRIYERLTNQGIEEEEAAQTARLQEELARLNVSPLVVCSAFALIRVLFASKRAEERMVPFFQARIVLDEIHAYDPEVTAMTLAALRFLEEKLEARSLIMSATIPTHLKTAIRHALGSRPEIPCGADILGRPPRHRVRLLAFESTSLDALNVIQQRATIGSVLVVMNQVGRAVTLYRSLKALGFDVYLLHGRFSYMDRMRIERNLSPHPGRVLIGTQAVEVSLDVDFDCCFSELAPIEALLQRFGRVNRYGLNPPAEANVFTGQSGRGQWWRPYQKDHLEQALVSLTRYCEQNSGLVHQSELQGLIDSSYPTAMASKLEAAVLEKSVEIQHTLVNSFRPFGVRDMEEIANLERAWEELFDGGEVLPDFYQTVASKTNSWIERSRYFVPISRHAWWWVKPEWNEEMNCFVTKAPYNPEYGLIPP